MIVEKRYTMNGDMREAYLIIECDGCHKKGQDSWSWYEQSNQNYCPECAFKIGLITPEYYLKNYGHTAKRVGINPHTGEVEFTNKNRFSWEYTPKDYRRDVRYKKWRTSVFERDSYTCQHCGKLGGALEAHHIRSFLTWESLRYETSNGITLCRDCHLKAHGRGRKSNE